jgi:hypothetical protein
MKLKSDEPPSNFACTFNMRRYAKAGAAGAGGAAAAAGGATVNVNTGGDCDWTTSEEASVLFNAVTPEVLQQRVDEGDREAQFSLGTFRLLQAAEPGAGADSPYAIVGLVL